MKHEQGTVTVRDLTGSDGKKLEPIEKAYTKTIFETVDDVLSALQNADSAKDTISLLNYAKDLKLRAIVRATILTENEGPGKAIDRLVKDILKMRAAVGKPVTEEVARKMASAMSDAAGA